MPSFRMPLAALALAALCATLSLPALALSVGEKAALQAAMQRHVDGQLVEGDYLHLDPETGGINRLHPVTAHPMIMTMGEHYVLCFDFRDDQGNEIPVDFYMAQRNRSYVVFHAAVNDRALLKRLMKAGKVGRADH